MKLFIISAVAVVALCTQRTFALPTENDLARRLAEVTRDLTWSGPIFPGDAADAHMLHGSARDIYNQILELNPSFNKKDFEDSSSSNKTLHRRNKIGGSGINCNIYAGGDPFDLETETSYLHNIGGNCYVRGGPRACIRMACKNTSGIFLCNDNTYPINPNCDYLASYADDIYDTCENSGVLSYSGQEFDTDNYNVIVGYANCNHDPTENPF